MKVARTSAWPSTTSLVVGRQQAGHRRLHLVEHLVDDLIGADVDADALGRLARLRHRAARGSRRRSRRSPARAARRSRVTPPTATCSTFTFTRSVESLPSASRIASAEPCTSAFTISGSSFVPPSAPREQILERDARLRDGRLPLARFVEPMLDDVLRDALALDGVHHVARTGHARETDDLHGLRRPRFLDRLPWSSFIDAHAAVVRADHDDVAAPQRAVLHEHGRDRTATLVELRLEHDAVRANRSGSARGSSSSACSTIASSSLSRPVRFVAETFTASVSPPKSSATRPCSIRRWRVSCGFASGQVAFVDGDDDRHFRRLRVRRSPRSSAA